jgi:hypothetical protein
MCLYVCGEIFYESWMCREKYYVFEKILLIAKLIKRPNQVFLHGSFLKSNIYKDIDIILIYTWEVFDKLALFEEVCKIYPLHISSFNINESRELLLSKRYNWFKIN